MGQSISDGIFCTSNVRDKNRELVGCSTNEVHEEGIAGRTLSPNIHNGLVITMEEQFLASPEWRGGEVKFANEGKEFSFDALFPRGPGMKFSHELREFIRREGTFHESRINQYTKEHQTGGWTLQLVMGQGDAQMVSSVNHDVNLRCT